MLFLNVFPGIEVRPFPTMICVNDAFCPITYIPTIDTTEFGIVNVVNPVYLIAFVFIVVNVFGSVNEVKFPNPQNAPE